MSIRQSALVGVAGVAIACAFSNTASAQTAPGAEAVPTAQGAGAAPSDATNPPAAPTQTKGAADDTVSEVVVTGIRASLRTAIQAKERAPNVVEVLSSEDIGKLPDVSIGEALARLPGLSTNRDRGNATQISIRGLSPDLANTLLNGREVVSAEPSRNIRYEQYPAELITGAYVYKSPTAAQVEGAIAGQVDLKTVRPLDYKERQFVVNGRGVYYDLGDKIKASHSSGWYGSASYVDQFFGGKLGVALGYSGRSEPVATERTNIFRYANSYQDLNGDGSANDEAAYGFEALVRGGTDTRHGALATVQWKPDDRLEVVGDFFYSHLRYKEEQRGFRVENFPYGNSFSGATVDSGSGATSLTGTNYADYGLQIENVNELYKFTDDLYAGGLNATYRGDNWKLVGDFGYSTTTRHQLFASITTRPNTGSTDFLTSGLSAGYASNPGGVPDLSVGWDLTDPSANYLYNVQVPTNGGGAPIIHDELYSGKLDFQYDTNNDFLKNIQIGTRFTSRDKDYTQRTFYYYPTPYQIGSQYILDPISFSGAYSGLQDSMALDIDGIIKSIGGLHPVETTDDLRSSWDVSEKTGGGYVQGNFATQIFGRDLTGNIGARIIHTHTRSQSTFLDTDGTPTPISVSRSFTDVLPNLNLTYVLSEGQQIRFAASKAISRAPLDSLNAGYAVYTSGTALSAYGGNPYLKPFKADQLDLTYERYFTKDTAVTISGFYKKVDTFIVNQVTEIEENGQEGTFSQPVNGKGGNIKGVELLYQQAFSFLPAPLDGFGVYANMSYTDSKVKVHEADNNIGAIPLPGLSKIVYNLVGYYAKYGIETRIAYRYRSHYATELGDTDRILITAGEGVLDFEASYEFPDSTPLHGLKIQFQANNLTDEPFETYYGDADRQGRFEKFGRRYWLGATYKF